MLLVPYLMGLLVSRPSWVHIPLLVALLGGYLLTYYASLALKTRRISRVRDQLLLYGAVTVPAAVVVLVARPGLLVWAPAFVLVLAVNAFYSWRRDDRAVVNDLVSVALGSLMLPVTAMAGGVPPSTLWPAFALVLLYFAGTVFYVKTMIRERGNSTYLRTSAVFHAVAAVVAWLIAWPLGLLFAAFFVRAVLAPRYRLSPKQIGLVEMGSSAALLVLVPLFAL
jgi:hypothetical protein